MTVTPEELARYFHEQYELLAPAFNYETRRQSAKPWVEVPENNKLLMVAVAYNVLQHWFPEHMGDGECLSPR